MAIGLVGKKCGMSRIFHEDGTSQAVSVLQVLPNRITQVKSAETDGYMAVQVTMGAAKKTRVTKPLLGHYAKANSEPGLGLWEFRFEQEELAPEQIKVGHEFKVDHFQVGQMVDVEGFSRGKGFAGVIKRHHFSSQDATHGNSLSHRAPGSIGQRQSPGKVFKGKRMGGHLGNSQVTSPNLHVVKIDMDNNLLLVSGAVPGAPNGFVVILPAAKAKNKTKGGAK